MPSASRKVAMASGSGDACRTILSSYQWHGMHIMIEGMCTNGSISGILSVVGEVAIALWEEGSVHDSYAVAISLEGNTCRM